MYTWVPFFEELGYKLADYENDQPQLVALLQQADIKVSDDQYQNGSVGPLQVMDPFTFFSLCMKHGKAKQLKILSALKRSMGLAAVAPTDTDGVATAPAPLAWLFRYAKDREAGDVPLLWQLYHQVQARQVSDDTFAQALALHGVAWPKLTQGLGCLLPKEYLPLNKQTRPYLAEAGLSYSFGSFEEYAAYQATIQAHFGKALYEVSYEAYLANQAAAPVAVNEDEDELMDPVLGAPTAYYCAGANWSGVNQLPRFLKEGIWENGYDKQFFDKVKGVPVGAALAIKAAYTRKQNGKYVSVMDIRARGWVTANPHNGKLLEVDWEPNFKSYELIGKGSYRGTIHKLWKPEHIAAIFPAAPTPPPLPIGEKTGGEEFEREYPAEVPYALNTILYGPPGTGKTYKTIEIAAHIATGQKPADHAAAKATFDELRGKQVDFVTFHQNYAYEDFVVGIKPSLTGGGLGFERHEGIFYRICQRARANWAHPTEQLRNYVLVVDEINRANMSRVLGELITLLEEDKRLGGANQLTVTLPLAGPATGGATDLEELAVPPNLYILGTMNTADKSIALLDVALRRRFEFRGLYPDYKVAGLQPVARQVLQSLNDQLLETKKSADFLIGHAMFLDKEEEALPDVLNRQVLPLLLEYYGGRQDLVKKMLSTALPATMEVGEENYQLLVKPKQI